MEELLKRWPDLIITFLGVLGGGTVAYYIARWQISNQNKQKEKNEKKLLKKIIEWLKLELKDNHEMTKQLKEVLNRSDIPDKRLWKWAISLVDSLSTKAYNYLLDNKLQKYLHRVHPNINDQLYYSYQKIAYLSNMLKQIQSEHEYYISYSGNRQQINKKYDDLKKYNQEVLNYLEQSIESLNEIPKFR